MRRSHYIKQIKGIFETDDVCVLVGPVDIGKATVAQLFAQTEYSNNYCQFSAATSTEESLLDYVRSTLNAPPQKLTVIEGIEHFPQVVTFLKTSINTQKQKFLLTSNAPKDLVLSYFENCRIPFRFLEISPLSIVEVENSERLWLRGGFPQSYLSESDTDSYLWREQYIKSFVTQCNVPSDRLLRLWHMVAHNQGQALNIPALSKSLLSSPAQVQSYLDLLISGFMLRKLMPWHAEIKKRQVSAPKLFFKDSGILNELLGIKNTMELYTSPKQGSLWESFALEELIQLLRLAEGECYFWATQAGQSVDLLVARGNRRIGFNFYFTESPGVTESLYDSSSELQLDHLALIYPGTKLFPLAEKITAYGFETIGKKEFVQDYKNWWRE